MRKGALVLDEEDTQRSSALHVPRGLWLSLGGIVIVALMIGLYQAKTEAQATRKNIAQLEQQLKQTRRAISAREAEIAYLERPERLRELARSKLNLSPVQTGQLKSLDELEESADPAREPAQVSAVDN